MWPLLAFGAGAMGAVGKYYEGYAKSQAYQLQAGVEKQNAAMLDKQGQIEQAAAEIPLLQGTWNAGNVARKVGMMSDARLSSFSGRNIQAGSGSPLLMEGFSASQGATDMALAAARGETGYSDALTRAGDTYGQAATQQWKAAADEQNAANAKVSGFFGAATSLLGTAASAWGGISGGVSSLTAASPMAVGNYSMPRIGNFWDYT